MSDSSVPTPNGEPPALPTLKITWDGFNQHVNLDFKPEEFKRWEFVIALLKIATDQAKARFAQAQQISMMNAMQEQQRAQALAQQLRLGGL